MLSLDNQKGFVLILTMVMLAILSILGVMVLNTTNTELSITSNYRIKSDSFFGAELLSEFAQARIQNDPFSISEHNINTISSDDVEDFLPNGVGFIENNNTIVFYTGAIPTRMGQATSVNIGQSNLYQASTGGVAGRAAFYRINTETEARGRGLARVEKVIVNRGGQVF